MSLDEAKIFDEWRVPTPAERERVRDAEVMDDWTQAATSDLEDPEIPIPHLDAKGLRYYLPPLMLRMLDAYQPLELWWIGTVAALDPRRGDPKGFVDMLTPAQRRAIALYVHALPSLINLDIEDARGITRAYRYVWSRYIPSRPER